jgi:hypothetical protein
MSESDTHLEKPRQVFLSYATGDRAVAEKIATALTRAGLRVWFDTWELASGDSIAERIEQAVSSSDLLLVLLSRRSVESQWVQKELGAALERELKDRAITVIPALIEDCEVPAALARRVFIDLRQDFDVAVQRLAEQLGAATELRLSSLTGQAFENLVADLLVELGFTVERIPSRRDSAFDLVASYRSPDPFGGERTETWLVQATFYREKRVSVDALSQLIFRVSIGLPLSKGLLVTNSRLTSVARSFLSGATERFGNEIRVIDGSELTNLLLQHPTLIRRHFSGSVGDE